MLHFLDVFGPYLVDKYCRSVVCCAVTCCCEGVSLSRRPQFIFLLSPSFSDREKVPMLLFKLA